VRESRSPVTTEEVGESLLRKIDDPRTIHGIEGTTTRATSASDSDECVRVFCISPVRSKETDFAPSRGHEKNASWLFLRSFLFHWKLLIGFPQRKISICTQAALSIARMAASSMNSRRGLGAGRSFRGSINRPRYHRIARPNRTVLSIRTSPNSNVLRSSSTPQARRLFNSSRQASVKSLSGSASLGSCTCCLNSPNVLLGSA
jgi:hypothetical protein